MSEPANQSHKLGCIPSHRDYRTVNLRVAIRPELPTPPPAREWDRATIVCPMYKNDILGDCVAAAAGHAEIVGTAATDAGIVVPSDAEIVDLYGAISGYDADTNRGDNGAEIIYLLKHWRKHPLHGQQLDGYAALNPRYSGELMAALNAFGPLIVGLALPVAWTRQTVWDAGGGFAYRPGTWGSHCVAITDYDADGVMCRTWARRQRITWGAMFRYCFEAWTLLQGLWDDQQPSPAGIDRDLLRQFIAAASQ